MVPIREFAKLVCENAMPGSPLGLLSQRESHSSSSSTRRSQDSSGGVSKNLLDEAITLLFAGKSAFALFCCVLWCVQYEDSVIRILHLNLVCLYVIALQTTYTNICCNHFFFIFINYETRIFQDRIQVRQHYHGRYIFYHCIQINRRGLPRKFVLFLVISMQSRQRQRSSLLSS